MKSFKFLFTLSIIALSALLTSCNIDEICTSGTGEMESQTLSVPAFTGLDLRIDGNVYLTQGDVQEVRVEGQANIIEKLKLDVDDQVWKIDFQGCTRNYDQLDIYITLPELDYLRIGGSGDIIGQTAFQVDDVDFAISGSGDLTLDLAGDHVNTKISGSGSMDLVLAANQLESQITGSGDLTYAGEVPTHTLDIRGSGKAFAFDLITQTTDVNISGSGDAEVFASESLEISIGGSGNVLYKGSPSLSVSVNGSGKVVDAN